MKTVTATQLARNTKEVLEQLAASGGEVVVVRNHRQVARLIGGPARQTALEAMADLYRTIPQDAATDWQKDGRDAVSGQLVDEGVRDPWDT